jgi:TonB-linked SusC/RagA family outer membrane protein
MKLFTNHVRHETKKSFPPGRRLWLAVCLFFGIHGLAFSQQVITGTVTGAEGETLPGVTVIVKDTNLGTATDLDGRFSLTVPPEQSGGTLVFSFIGYTTQEVPIGSTTVFNVVMAMDVKTLQEVVIVGFGEQKKQTVTGSVVSVDVKELKQSPVANVSNALVGRVAGLVATQSSGEPGQDAATLRIRGISTLNGSGGDPLVIIDGVQRDFFVLNALDINEIENISVLKDASSTAVYGVRGANGVVIVTTKRGETGRPQVSFSSNYGVTQMTFPLKMLGSYEYAKYRNEAIARDGDPSFDQLVFSDDELWKFQHNRDYTPAEVDAMSNLTAAQRAALNASPALYYTSHDWFDEQYGKAGPQQQYNVNLSGGSDNVRYFTSVGRFSQDGSVANSNYGGTDVNSFYDRYNFRSNFDIDVAKNVQVAINVGGQISNFGGILGKDGDITSQFSRNKEMTVLLVESSPFAGPGIIDNHLITDYVEGGANPLSNKGGGGYSPTAYVLGADYLRSRTSNLNTSVEIRHTMDYLIQGLSAHATVSYDNRYMKSSRYFPSIPTYSVVRNPADPSELLFFGGSVGPTTVDDEFANDKWRRFYLEGALDYKKDFGKHLVTGLALFNAQKTFDPGLRYNVPAGLMGVVGRVTYEYDERYLAEFNMGYNGSENFPENNRFGFFPAFSAGWIISNENFFPRSQWVTWLKVRGSYGEVGNDKIGGNRYLYLPSTWDYGGNYPTGGYYFGNSNGASRDPYYVGASEDAVGNPNVTWERAKKSNIGLEMRFLNDRLSFTGDYFQEKRDNILWELGTVPSLVGADLPPANIGRVSNKGYEMELGWADQVGAVGYYVKGNVSYARNRIEFMDEPSFPYAWMNATGFSLGQYKGYYNDGFYNNAAEANNRPRSTVDGNRVQAGDLRYIDMNGDGLIDINDQVPVGFSNLPQYAFSGTVGFSFKGFAVSALFIGTANGSLPLADFEAPEDSPIINPFARGSWGAMEYQYDGRWTPDKVEQGITPTFPRASMTNATTQNGVASNFWVKSTDFVRLKNVEVSYTFSNIKVSDKLTFKNIRIYGNGNNLYTFGNHIMDPEQQDAGAVSRGYLYPITRIYNFGVNVQF